MSSVGQSKGWGGCERSTIFFYLNKSGPTWFKNTLSLLAQTFNNFVQIIVEALGRRKKSVEVVSHPSTVS